MTPCRINLVLSLIAALGLACDAEQPHRVVTEAGAVVEGDLTSRSPPGVDLAPDVGGSVAPGDSGGAGPGDAPPPPVDRAAPTPDAGGSLTPEEKARKAIVDSVVLKGAVDLSKSPCMGKPGTVDARGPLRLAGNKTGGLNTGNGIKAPVGGCLVGAAVRANWARDLTWQKVGHAGDGIVWGGGAKTTTIHGAYIDNFADGLAPPKSPKTDRASKWVIKNVYARYNRDDLIENDACLDGTLHDSLIDGTFAFISSRPGKSNQAKMAKYTGHVTVTNTLVYMQCMPGTFGSGNCGPKLDMGQIFKWSDCGGPVVIKDTIIYVDPNDTRTLFFPKGTYQNVHIIWPGPAGKKFPAKSGLPSGVTLSRDVKLWEMARKRWMDRHGCDPKGDHCTMTDKP